MGGCIIEKRNYFYDTLKGFLIICVIVGNSLEYNAEASTRLHYFILCLYIFHMPLFSFISGYFNNKSKRTTQEKVLGILKIYLCAQLFYYFINKLVFDEINSKFELFTPNWTMWYFVSLMSWYIISDFIKNKKMWLIVSFLIAIFIGFDESVGTYASISRTFFFLPYFLLGMYFKDEYLDKLKRYRVLLGIATSIFFVILYFMSSRMPADILFEYAKYSYFLDANISPIYIRIFHYIGSFIVGGFILSIAPNMKTKLSIIGRDSLVLYVSHSFIIKLLYKYDYTNYSTSFDILLSIIKILFVTICIGILYSLFKFYYKKIHKSININLSLYIIFKFYYRKIHNRIICIHTGRALRK